MKQNRSSLMKLLRDERGAVLILTTVYLPVIVGFFTMAVDMSYVLRTRNTLQVTADSAALAGLGKWINDPTFDKTQACPAAKEYATKNMDTTKYGYVLKQNTADCSDVLVGKWDGIKFTSDASSACNLACDAVQVTTRMSAANSNPLPLAFASMIGIPTFNIVAQAVATYGNDPGATPWNVSIVQDVSGSFTQEINNAKDADKALLTCMNQYAASASKVGIELFGRTATTAYQSPALVDSNGTLNNDLVNKINGIAIDGNGISSSATNIAAGINSGIAETCPGTTCTAPICSGTTCTSTNSFNPALVIVSDGMPNTCSGNNCNPQTAAETAAQAAADKGMDVFVIYFCNDGNNTCGSAANQTSEYLAGQWLSNKIAKDPLKTGKARFFSTATPENMKDLMKTGVCAPQFKIRLVL